MKTAVAISRARTIPAHFYTCPKIFQLEKQKVFANSWVNVGRINTLKKVGDFMTGCFLKDPYSIIKTDTGLKAFHNVCRHHGTVLLSDGDEIKNKTMQCKYHGWQYSLDGKLTKATRLKGIEDFSAKKYSLHPIPITTLGPLAFLNFGNSTPQPPFPLPPPPISNTTLGLDFSQYVHVKTKTFNQNCNWKVVIDNFLDGAYHVPHAHPLLNSSIDMKQYKTEVFDTYSVQSCPGTDPARIGTEAKYFWLKPNLTINVYGDWIDTNLIVPTETEKCKVIFDYYLKKQALQQLGVNVDPDATNFEHKLPEKFEKELQVSQQIQDEDEILCERVQEGMHSSSFTVGRYAPTVEHGMYHFHQLLRESMPDQFDDISGK